MNIFLEIKISIRTFVSCGISSVGRALASQAEGRGIVPRLSLLERVPDFGTLSLFTDLDIVACP